MIIIIPQLFPFGDKYYLFQILQMTFVSPRLNMGTIILIIVIQYNLGDSDHQRFYRWLKNQSSAGHVYTQVEGWPSITDRKKQPSNNNSLLFKTTISNGFDVAYCFACDPPVLMPVLFNRRNNGFCCLCNSPLIYLCGEVAVDQSKYGHIDHKLPSHPICGYCMFHNPVETCSFL